MEGAVTVKLSEDLVNFLYKKYQLDGVVTDYGYRGKTTKELDDDFIADRSDEALLAYYEAYEGHIPIDVDTNQYVKLDRKSPKYKKLIEEDKERQALFLSLPDTYEKLADIKLNGITKLVIKYDYGLDETIHETTLEDSNISLVVLAKTIHRIKGKYLYGECETTIKDQVARLRIWFDLPKTEY